MAVKPRLRQPCRMLGKGYFVLLWHSRGQSTLTLRRPPPNPRRGLFLWSLVLWRGHLLAVSHSSCQRA